MTSFTVPRLSEEELLSSQSSDEKMDTGSESIRSQDTPNSVLSSDFEGEDVLRLQNPDNGVLRLSEPEKMDSRMTELRTELNDSLINKMSLLHIHSPTDNRPRNLGISPPRLSSTLTLATNHPLMGLVSPDENYPDVIPKKIQKPEEEKDLSLSSIEDEKTGHTNGYELYTPQRNTSKNNLYFSENFVTADSQLLSDSLNACPDVTRVEQLERRKVTPIFRETRKEAAPRFQQVLRENGDDSAIIKYVEERNKKLSHQSTPKTSVLGRSVDDDGFPSGVSEWCDSPIVRPLPNFDLPIEMSSNVALQNDLESPDVVSSSTQEDKSAYQALLDPYTGSVALRPTAQKNPTTQRRKVHLPPEDDSCSLDSISGCSMESEDEPPLLEPELSDRRPSGDDDTKRSKSTNTASECSDPIPEYSAAEEFREERSWLSVAHSGGISNCDMKVIEPYKRAISHGGYDKGDAAIIVFSACHLPDRARPDYRYVMDNLFLYVIWTLERLVTDEYVLVYLHGARHRTPPSVAWLHECYKLIDRRLRKSLKHLYLVHPSFWLKSFVVITKPFVSSKFFRKLSYVRSLDELLSKVPVEPNAIPDKVKEYDARRR